VHHGFFAVSISRPRLSGDGARPPPLGRHEFSQPSNAGSWRHGDRAFLPESVGAPSRAR
jgi:hypothetical protein